MEKFTEFLDSQNIDYEVVDDNIVDVFQFGKMMYADMSKKKTVFRLRGEKSKDNDVENVELNVFQTREELMADNIVAIAFELADEYNYVLTKDESVKIYPLFNIGLSLLPELDFDYVNLGAHTGMELLSGSGIPSHWIQRASFLGHRKIGICDHNTMANTYNFQKECDEWNAKNPDKSVNPIFGYSTAMDNLTEDGLPIKLYVHNNDGFENMLRIHKFITIGDNDDATFKVTLDVLKQNGSGLSIVFGKTSAEWVKNNNKAVEILKSSFDNVYFQIDFNEYKANRIDIEVLDSLKVYFNEIYNTSKHIEPILILDTYYANQIEYKNRALLAKINKTGYSVSDQQWYKNIDEIFSDMNDLFSDKFNPKEILKQSADNTLKLAESCDFKYKTDTNYMPIYNMTDEESEKYGGDRIFMFDSLLEDGLKNMNLSDEKYPIYRNRLDEEKYVIKSTNNVDYMLVQRDVVNWSAQNDILVGAGRGSAGGCLILYLLGVTQVDPIRFDLLFERFLLPERAGLYEAMVTKLGETESDSKAIEIEFEDGKTIILHPDSIVKLTGEERPFYADELNVGDEIEFDNIDKLFNI